MSKRRIRHRRRASRLGPSEDACWVGWTSPQANFMILHKRVSRSTFIFMQTDQGNTRMTLGYCGFEAEPSKLVDLASFLLPMNRSRQVLPGRFCHAYRAWGYIVKDILLRRHCRRQASAPSRSIQACSGPGILTCRFAVFVYVGMETKIDGTMDAVDEWWSATAALLAGLSSSMET